MANNGLPPWIVALVMAGASISGWVVLGFPGMIATQGFGFATLGLAGTILPLAGILFFKRQRVLARRYRIYSQGEMFHRYYGERGLAVNLLAVIVISADHPGGRGHSELGPQMRAFLRTHAPARVGGRTLKLAAWSAVLAWFFLALGPGVVLGNRAFGAADAGFYGWLVGMPSLWAWSLLFWVLGVFLIWFLAYRLELATAPATEISPVDEMPRLLIANARIQEGDLVRLLWSVAVLAGGIALVAWIFG